MNFKKQIVSANLAKNVTTAGVNPHEYIIIHQTGNTSKGANAQAHANIQSKGNTRAASWHESIDDKEVSNLLNILLNVGMPETDETAKVTEKALA